MGEFRIGRSRAQHSYPDTRGAGPAGFARNSAFGPPDGIQAISATGDKIKWSTLEVGTPGSTEVPITPQVTGIVRVIGSVVCRNTALSSANTMTVEIFIGGVGLGARSISTIDGATESESGFITIPVLFDFAGPSALSVGVAHKIELNVVPLQGGTSTAVVTLSSIDIQELPAATG